MYDNPWTFEGRVFTSDDIGDHMGFVYIITDTLTDKKYIGKKLFKSKRRLPPLKGKTRRRVKVTESDWKEYYGSNEEIQSLVEEHGGNRFKREILKFGKSKGELSYLEAELQFEHKVLLKPDEYYNGIIQVKVHRTHVSKLLTE